MTFLLALMLGAGAGTIGASDLVEVVDISSLALSPDGRTLAFRTEHPSIATGTVELVWHVVPTDGSLPARPVAGGGIAAHNGAGTVETAPPIWAGDSSGFYFRAAIDGERQIWRAPLDGRAPAAVTAEAGDVGTVELGDNRTTLVYTVGPDRQSLARAERAARDDGVRIDRHVELATGVAGGVMRDGKRASVRLAGTWLDRTGLIDTQPVTKVLPLERATPDATPGGARDDEKTAVPAVAAICKLAACPPGRGSVVQGPGMTALLTFTGAALDQQLYRWDGATLSRLAGGSGLLAGSRDSAHPCAVSATYVFCVAADTLAPPHLVRIALADGATQTLFDPNAPLATRIAVDARTIEWRDASGTMFAGRLITPRGEQSRLPLVIDYYRCAGFLRGGLGDELPVIPLAAAGVAVLCVNAAAMQAPQDARRSYDLALGGIEAVIDLLANEGRIDRARVGMSGLSFGSEVAMWVARRSDLLAAISIASVQIEPGYYWANAVAGRDAPDLVDSVWGLGPPGEDEPRWRLMSSARDVAAIRAPLLMQLPEYEARWSAELHARLSRTHIPVELYAFPDSAHVKAAPRQKHAVYERNLDWFTFWLKGAIDPAPGKAAQFDRWRCLRDRWIKRIRADGADGPCP